MQAQTILPVPSPVASAGSPPARGPGTDDGNGSGEQFSRALTREIGQRQQQPQGPAATSTKAPPPAGPAQGAAVAAGATPGDDGSETGVAVAGVDASAAATAADLSAIAPVTDMLALAAALSPATSTATAAAAAAAAAAPAAAANDPVPAAAGAPEAIAAAGTPTGLAVAATATELASPAAAGAGAPASNPQAASPDGRGLAPAPGANATQQVPDAAGASLPAPSPRQAESTAAARPAFAEFVAQAAQLRQAPRDDAPAVAASGITDAAPLPLPSAQQPLQAARPELQPGVAGQLPARVGTPAWDNQVGQQVVWMAGAGEQTAELTLNPPDLGPMRIVLAVSDDKASIAFTSAQPEVRQALEAAMPRLRDMLGETGISLGDATVSAGTPGDRSPDEHRAPARSVIASGDGPVPAAAAPLRRAAPGLVDTFA